MSKEKESKQQIKVRYNETTALYASQFIINSTPEDLTINFSSGPITDPGGGEAVLPIHTRIALTPTTARKLHSMLGNILANQQKKAAQESAATTVETDPKQRH